MIINKFQIKRYKEVVIEVPAGTVIDGGFSTFQLDDPSVNPDGSGDFLGVIKRVVLLGEVIQNTLDTGNLNFFQFNNLTKAEFENLLADPTSGVKMNPQTRGLPKTIGWVELARTRPSFYYEDCIVGGTSLDGKFTKSENYFALEDFEIGITVVSGDGNDERAIQPIRNWDYAQAYFNWGITPFPNQEPMDFASYMTAVTNGGQVQGGTVTEITSQRLFQIPILIANRAEHFDSSNQTFTLTPSFSDKKNQNGLTIEKNVYGRIRYTAGIGFKSSILPVNTGECGPTGVVTGPRSGGEDSTDVDLDSFNEEQLGDILYDKDLPPFNPCGDGPKPFNGPPYDVISEDEVSKFLSYNVIQDPGDGTGLDVDIVESLGTDERDMDILRKIYQSQEIQNGIRDPREFTGDNYDIPAGMVYALLNQETCTYDLFPALRDKDGDIPEPIGPVLSYYFSRVRQNMIERFGVLDSPLRNLGTGSDGYYRYSDGNSYVELLGEAVFGCGDPLSFGLDIPEVVVEMSEMYKVKYKTPQSINSYLTDISYGIPSGFTTIRTENTRTGTREQNIPERWQNVMYPIYDSIWKSDSEIDYNEVDESISIEVTGSIERIYEDTERPGISWDWLLSRGFGQFQVGFTYKFSATPGEPGTISKANFDVIGFAQFIAGITALAIDWLSDLFDGEPESTVSIEEKRLQSPKRRLHKKGNLVLMSKSGLYSTTRKPCEQIFLGFADNYYSVNSSARRANIENLIKTDETGSLIVVNKKVDVANQNLARPLSSASSKTEIIPALFPRIKKYGRNPLLDVFYLNVITPGIQYGGNGTSSNRYSNTRRFSHPSRVPFRRSKNTSNNNWSDLKYGQFPSILPQNWNNIFEINGMTSDKFTDENKELSYGDSYWKDRVKNTILSLKDRWTMYIEYLENDTEKPVAVLKDNTRILDLYFGLMELHVKGVSWKEILEYVDFAVSCVSGTAYSERIDTEKLERLWKIVFNRLNEIQEKGSSRQNEFYVGSYDFGEVVMIENGQSVSPFLQNFEEMYKTGILIQNRSDSDVTIEYILIQSDEEYTDIYGRTSSDYFFINDVITNRWSTTSPPRLIPRKNSISPNTTFYELPVYFIPYMAQPDFDYSANVVVGIRKSQFEVEEVTGIISGRCITDRITDSVDESLTEPLILPSSIDFGFTELKITPSQSNLPVVYANRSYHESVKIKSFEIQSQMLYNTDGTNGKEMNAEKPFKFYSVTGRNVSSDTSSQKIELDTTLPSLKNDDVPVPSEIKISFVPEESNKVYTAELILTYEVPGRSNEESKTFTRTILLTGVSV